LYQILRLVLDASCVVLQDDLDSYEVVFGGHDAGFRAESAYSIGGYQPTTPRSSGYEWRSAGFGVCSATCLGLPSLDFFFPKLGLY
jgi:hypothetical protein